MIERRVILHKTEIWLDHKNHRIVVNLDKLNNVMQTYSDYVTLLHVTDQDDLSNLLTHCVLEYILHINKFLNKSSNKVFIINSASIGNIITDKLDGINNNLNFKLKFAKYENINMFLFEDIFSEFVWKKRSYKEITAFFKQINLTKMTKLIKSCKNTKLQLIQ